MADNIELNAGSGGKTVASLQDASSIDYPVGVGAFVTSEADPDVLLIPIAAALSDAVSNPTTLTYGSAGLVWTGASWARAPGNATDGALVNLGANNDVTLATLPDTSGGDLAAINAALAGTLTVGSHDVTNAGTFAVQAAQSGNWSVRLQDGGGTALTSTLVGSDQSLDVNLTQAVTLTVDGSGVTQPVSASSLPLPTGASTAANQSTIIGHVDGIEALLTTIDADTGTLSVVGGGTEATALRVTIASDSTGVLSVDDGGGSLTVDGTVGVSGTVTVDGSGVTQPISAASLPLPTGAATSAKQPALGTAGTASSDVITVQGIASMTAIVVDGSGVTQPVSNAGTFAVQESGAALTALQLLDDAVYTIGTGTPSKGLLVMGSDGTNPRAILTNSSGLLRTEDNFFVNNVQADSESGFEAPLCLGWDYAGSAAYSLSVDSSGRLAVRDGGLSLTVDMPAVTTGGATAYKLISAASTNATSVKASAATLYGIQVYSTNAAARYLKLYNKASAPTVGTDTPVKVITIPGNTAGGGSNVSIPVCGIAFGTGLAFALTTGAADSDTGAVAANEIVVNLDYK